MLQFPIVVAGIIWSVISFSLRALVAGLVGLAVFTAAILMELVGSLRILR